MHHTFYRPLDKNKHLKIAATSHGNPYEHRMVRDSTLGLTRADIDPESWNGWRNYTLKGEVNDGNAWYALQGISGAAGLFSTAGDVQILVDMLKNKGLTGKKKIPIGKDHHPIFYTRSIPKWTRLDDGPDQWLYEKWSGRKFWSYRIHRNEYCGNTKARDLYHFIDQSSECRIVA